MKKRWFNARLYGEVFRQLKNPGILLTILCSLFAHSGANRYLYNHYPPRVIGFDYIFPLGRVCLVFLAPLFVLLAFRYAMKRRDSDFYDSLPVTRTAIFFSRFAAAMTWTVIIIVAQTAVGLLSCRSVLPSMHSGTMIAYGEILRTMFGVLAANLRIGAVVSLAITFCGTSLTVLTATVLIQFFPIIYFNVIKRALENAHSRVEYMIRLPDGTLKNNPVRLALGDSLETLRKIVRIDYFYDEGEVFWTQTLFSVVVAVLILSLALFLFRRRRSDLAGQSTAKPFIHTCMRMGVALLPLELFNILNGRLSMLSITMPLFFYISYEMIVVRKWKRLLASLAWIPLLAVLYLLPYWVQELIVWYSNSL